MSSIRSRKQRKQKEKGEISKRTYAYRLNGTSGTKDTPIRPIVKSPGVLVEKLASLTTSSITWKIIQQVNLEPFMQQGEKLLNNWRILT